MKPFGNKLFNASGRFIIVMDRHNKGLLDKPIIMKCEKIRSKIYDELWDLMLEYEQDDGYLEDVQ